MRALLARSARGGRGRLLHRPQRQPPQRPTASCDARGRGGGRRARRDRARAFDGLDHGVLQAVSDFDMPHGDERFDARVRRSSSRWPKAGRRPPDEHLADAARPHSASSGSGSCERAEKAVGDGLDDALPGRPARHRRAARAGGHLPPVHGLPELQGDQPPAARGARAPRCATRRARRRCSPRRPSQVAGDGSPLPPLGRLPPRQHRLGRDAPVPARRGRPTTSRRARRASAAEAMRRGERPLERRSTTRCSSTTARRCSTSRSTTTRDEPRRGARDAHAPAGAAGPERRRRARRHDLRRELPDLPAHPLGAATATTTASRSSGGADAGLCDTARYIGLHRPRGDRGRAEGRLNVIDFDALCACGARAVSATCRPAASGSCSTRAATWRPSSSGEVVVRDDVLHEARPGRLVRLGR